MYGEVLVHHGVKGQKWGVRRYQNEDGSLTSAGKKKISAKKVLATTAVAGGLAGALIGGTVYSIRNRKATDILTNARLIAAKAQVTNMAIKSAMSAAKIPLEVIKKGSSFVKNVM